MIRDLNQTSAYDNNLDLFSIFKIQLFEIDLKASQKEQLELIVNGMRANEITRTAVKMSLIIRQKDTNIDITYENMCETFV